VVVALAPGGGDAAGWEPAPVRSASSCCGSGVWEPALVRSAASGCVWPVRGSVITSTIGEGPVNSATDSSRRTRPHSLDSSGAGTRPAASLRPWDRPQHAAYRPLIIQFFCITPIQAALNDFWGLSRRERCLDKPQKSLNTIRDRGDAEAPNAGISQPI
jgi:hypothetical protein